MSPNVLAKIVGLSIPRPDTQPNRIMMRISRETLDSYHGTMASLAEQVEPGPPASLSWLKRVVSSGALVGLPKSSLITMFRQCLFFDSASDDWRPIWVERMMR